MAKDPAFLFYYSDFLVGTEFLTNEETGAYIKILCHMADKGRMTKKRMLNVCNNNQDILDGISDKFIVDENGLYYQKRLEEEVTKRKKFVESRRKSRLGATKDKKHTKNVRNSYVPRMENENINENVNKDKDKNIKSVPDFCFDLATLLKEKILALNPTANVKNGWKERWANEIRLMAKEDNRTPEQISFLINYVSKDDFWSGVVLSAASLRKNFDKIVAQARAKHKKANKNEAILAPYLQEGKV